MKKKKRVYDFELPREVNGFMITMGLDELKRDGLFAKLPSDLQEQMENTSMFGSITVTKEMCDEIDDKTWTRLATMAHLDWHFA